jgi:predicted GNAT family acetyltransferase
MERAVSELVHNEAGSRYELGLDGSTAIAEYRRQGDVLTFTHTEVPGKLQGQGIGTRLVGLALDDVRKHGLKIVPRCWFVASFVANHPQYRDLLA